MEIQMQPGHPGLTNSRSEVAWNDVRKCSSMANYFCCSTPEEKNLSYVTHVLQTLSEMSDNYGKNSWPLQKQFKAAKIDNARARTIHFIDWESWEDVL